MRKYIPYPSGRYVLKMAVLCLIYFLTAKFGLTFYSVYHFTSMFWLPTGVALACLILYGYDLWPAITIGAFIAYLGSGVPVWVALAIALGNTAEALVGTYLLRRYAVLYRCFERLNDTLLFIGAVVLCAAPINAIVSVVSLLAGHLIMSAEVPSLLVTWWIGDIIGALVVAPFILTCFAPTRRWNADDLTLVEIFGFMFILIFSNLLIFWYPFSQFKNIPLLYLILLPLIWGGLRFGSRGLTFSVLITSILATVGTVLGHGPFVMQPTTTGVLYLQIFIGSIAITFLVFLSIVKERKLYMKKLEEHIGELEHALKKISLADQAKNDFLAVLGHELRNPLAPVLSSLELMKIRMNGDGQEKQTFGGLVKTMETHIYTMSRLLNDLMDISRISHKKLTLEKEPFNLQDIIKRSIEEVESNIQAKKHTLTVHLPEAPVIIFGDPVRIEQVIVNLLVNASKYTEPGGQIYLDCTVEKNTVAIRIRDNGTGIDPHMLTRIFEPFLQGHKHVNSNGPSGLGVGLSLSQELVRLHGGNIEAKSKGVNKGSEFIVTLPISMESYNKDLFEKEISEGGQAPRLGSGSKIGNIILEVLEKKYKILVVDDNVMAAQGISELLRHKGHEVIAVHDALSVMDTIKDFRPDVVVLDIGLPHMSGYQLAEKIRMEIVGEMTLIALTGYGQEEDKRRARRAGFDYHLTKPISIADIENILSSL